MHLQATTVLNTLVPSVRAQYPWELHSYVLHLYDLLSMPSFITNVQHIVSCVKPLVLHVQIHFLFFFFYTTVNTLFL